MVTHIYGIGESQVSTEQLQIFANELVMWVEYISVLTYQAEPEDKQAVEIAREDENQS